MDRIEGIHVVTRRLILMTLVAVLFFTLVFVASYLFNQRFMLTWAGFLCGIIGGFVSIQQRLPTVSDQELALLTRSWFQILLVPIFGGIFALVLYGIFLGGLVSGSLFPTFHLPERPTTGPDDGYMLALFTQTYPDSGQDLARFLFWSFVAGFSERFVPQVITRVSSSASER